MAVLYVAFAAVTLWLIGEVLMQRRAALHWRLLALLGFLAVAGGVAAKSIPVIVGGVVVFGVGQIFVTLSVRRGDVRAWGIDPPWRKGGGAPRAEEQPRLHASPVEAVEPAPAPPADPSVGAETAAMPMPDAVPEQPQYAGYEGYEGYDPAAFAPEQLSQQPAGQPEQPVYDPAAYGGGYDAGYGGQQPAAVPFPEQAPPPYPEQAHDPQQFGWADPAAQPAAQPDPYAAPAYEQAAYGYQQQGQEQQFGYGYPSPEQGWADPQQQAYDPSLYQPAPQPAPEAEPQQPAQHLQTQALPHVSPQPYDPYESGEWARPVIPPQAGQGTDPYGQQHY